MTRSVAEVPRGAAQGVTMRLHGYYQSSAAYRVRIALNLKGLSYENLTHHLRKGEQRDPAYLRLNPQGLVPALETHDPAVLTQSLAIIEYLEEVHPQPALLPSPPLDRARVRALAQVCAIDIHPINNLRVLKYLKAGFGLGQERIDAWYRHWVKEGFSALETLLASDARTGRYCHGDEPGLADICLIPQVFNARRFKVDMARYPTIDRVANAAANLPAFEKAHPDQQPDAE